MVFYVLCKGSLEVKLPTQWTDEKQRWEESEKRSEEKRRGEERRREKRREEERRKKKEDQKRESLRRKKIQVREKVGKSRNTVSLQWFVARGSNSRLAKAAGAEPSGQMRDEKLHAIATRSTFPSQNVQSTPGSDHFWKLRCGKSARCCGAKQISKSKCTKHNMFGPLLEVEMREALSKSKSTKHTSSGPLLEVEMSKKWTPLWCEAHFEVKMLKNTRGSDHFWTFRCRSAWQAQGIVDLVSEQNVRVLQLFQKRWQAWGIWRGSAKMHFPWQAQYKRHVHQRCWEVRALISWEGLHFGASDLQVCYDDFAWEAQHFVWPGITFSWQAQYSRQMEWKNRKTHWYEADSSAFNFPFLKEVSHNCFVFDVVNVENWGSLAELLRFWRCQGQKLRKSRRLAVLLILSSSKMEDVSQNCCVFKLADRQTDTHRQTDKQTDRQTDR